MHTWHQLVSGLFAPKRIVGISGSNTYSGYSLVQRIRNAWRSRGERTARWRVRGSSSDACSGKRSNKRPCAACDRVAPSSSGRIDDMRCTWSKKLILCTIRKGDSRQSISLGTIHASILQWRHRDNPTIDTYSKNALKHKHADTNTH